MIVRFDEFFFSFTRLFCFAANDSTLSQVCAVNVVSFSFFFSLLLVGGFQLSSSDNSTFALSVKSDFAMWFIFPIESMWVFIRNIPVRNYWIVDVKLLLEVYFSIISIRKLNRFNFPFRAWTGNENGAEQNPIRTFCPKRWQWKTENRLG